MKTYVNNEGWTFETHDRNLDLFTLGTETILKDNKYWVYLAKIAHSQGLTRHVYFVDMLDRNAWITMYQCRTKSEAMEMLQNLKAGKTARGES